MKNTTIALCITIFLINQPMHGMSYFKQLTKYLSDSAFGVSCSPHPNDDQTDGLMTSKKREENLAKALQSDMDRKTQQQQSDN